MTNLTQRDSFKKIWVIRPRFFLGELEDLRLERKIFKFKENEKTEN